MSDDHLNGIKFENEAGSPVFLVGRDRGEGDEREMNYGGEGSCLCTGKRGQLSFVRARRQLQ